MVNSNEKTIDNIMITSIILKALNYCKTSRPKRSKKNNFPSNPWDDKDCKGAKKMAKVWDNKREYAKIVRLKK